ncbi:MAG: type I DNA topoisomerase [Bacilli bacterium]|nr:type I DNA topoisomerase [Bacilli bacterium]
MKLVIVESPNKCVTIGKYLGSEYKVVASKGNIRDLSTRGKGGLGIDIDNNFAPDYVIPSAKRKVVDDLIKEKSKASEVYLATDPDREGEAISWHLAQVLKLPVDKTKRLEFHEITKEAIDEAIANPTTINLSLVNAQETRRMYDRIIGFKLSGLLQSNVGTPSAGRVQSAALKMVVDNDAEINSFVPEEYWVITIETTVEGKKVKLTLDKIDGKAAKIKSKEEAEAILKRIGDELDLVDLSVKKVTKAPPFPFVTSSLQQEAFRVFGFKPEDTQKYAQKLFEGLDVNGEHVGLITYIRTDSTRLAPRFFYNHAKPYILEIADERYVGSLRNPKSKDHTQDAHEAIRPTGMHRTPEIVAKYVSPGCAKLYKLIYNRALASCMSSAIIEQTTATFMTNGLSFKASGSYTVFDGFTSVYKNSEEDDQKSLPKLDKNKKYMVSSSSSEQKFTKGPDRFSEAKLVKMMEEKGIGRPSTYATTIKTLKDRGYVTSSKGILTPTENGIKTTKALEECFKEIVSTEYTSNMENDLDKIASGEESKLQALNDFYQPFMKKFAEATDILKNKPQGICPKCGKPLVMKNSRYGSFIACSNYPSCDYKEPKPVTDLGRACPLCGKPLVERKSKGKTFIGCSGYPSCHYIEEKKKAIKHVATAKKEEIDPSKYVKECPRCHTGHLIVKQGRRASFLGCTNFPKCRYHEWIEKKGNGK